MRTLFRRPELACLCLAVAAMRSAHPADTALVDTKTFAVVAVDAFAKSDSPGAGIFANTYYTEPTGLRLLSIQTAIRKSDTFENAFSRLSEDNGRTWSPPIEQTAVLSVNGLVRRQIIRGGIVNPVTGDYLQLSCVSQTSETDDRPITRNQQLYYSVSPDGGKTFSPPIALVQSEPGFDETHPFPGVWRDKNPLMIGDYTCRPLVLTDGRVIIPAQSIPLDPQGARINPRKSNGYYEAVLVQGAPAGKGKYQWKVISRISAQQDLDLSPRGLIEPTLARLDGGRWMCVLRGNGGHRLVSFSADEGKTWTPVQPWTFADGAAPYSPSSCSQLLAHSDGRIFWLGNLCQTPPKDNLPRYPFWIAEVDRRSGLLKRQTLSCLDDRKPGEDSKLTLSNFSAREDRAKGDILLHLTRLFARDSRDWTADALLYRVRVTAK